MKEKLQCSALDLTILPPRHCYPVHRLFFKTYFQPEKSAEVLKIVEDSDFVHVYSSLSKKIEVRKNSETAYIQLAKKHCPQVYESANQNFE